MNIAVLSCEAISHSSISLFEWLYGLKYACLTQGKIGVSPLLLLLFYISIFIFCVFLLKKVKDVKIRTFCALILVSIVLFFIFATISPLFYFFYLRQLPPSLGIPLM